MNQSPAGTSPEETALLSAPNGEVVLLIGGALLTLLLVAFVIGLIVTIVREERAVGRETVGSNAGDAAIPDSDDVPEARK